MIVVDGDLLDVTDGLIAHQVNCKGVMGAGVAAQIARRYPAVKAEYVMYCDGALPVELLGQVLVVRATPSLLVANVFGQESPGRGLRTDYHAVAVAVRRLVAFGERHAPGELHVPYGMGCGLAGGDWETYSAVLEDAWPGEVVAHRL